MKVKTRRGPGLTGSQKNYGLVTGSIWNYEDKPTSNNVGTTLSPVPRDEATIEAERGETVIGDLDNDGMVEHAKIGGKRHSHGGTPLNVPDGSFVFSDYRGLLIKNGDVLKNIFGMSSGKAVTPAKVAQRYEINKFKNMLNNPFIDPIDRKTAQLMIDNNMRKLGQLALIQEGMKGFPDGIPAIAMPLMGSDFAQQGPQQQMMKKGGVVKYKKGGLSKYQGVEESQVQIPLRPRGAILSPNVDPSIAMPMGNWELLGTDPDYGDVYQNERGEQIANVDGNWTRLLHGPEPVKPSASRDWNNDGYNDELDAAYQQQMMQNVFGDVNYQPPANDDIAYQTLEYKTPGTPAYYAYNAANIFTNPGSALMYALDQREKNSTLDAYLQNNNNPIGDVLDIGAAGETGFIPWLGAEYLKHRIEKEDPYNFEERAKDKNVQFAGPGEGWKSAAGTALAIGAGAGLTWLANKVGGKKALLNYRKKLFPELYASRLEPFFQKEKKFIPGQKNAIEQWEKYGEGNQRVGRFFKNKEFKEALAAGNTKAKNIWEYTYGDKTFPKYLRDRFGPKAWINFLEKPYYSKNPWVQRGLIAAELSALPVAVGLYNEAVPSSEFTNEEKAKGLNTLKSSNWSTIGEAEQDSIAAWAKTQGIPNFKALPDSAKSKWTAVYLQQLNNARTMVSDSISNAADDIGGKVEAITADSNVTGFNYKDPSFQKFYTKSLQSQGYNPNDYPFDKLPEENKTLFINAFNSQSKKKDEVKEKAVEKKSVKVKLPPGNSSEEWGKNNFDDWDTLSTASKNQILRQYGRAPIKRDGGSILNKFVGGGGSRYYYITPEKRAQIEQKGWDDIQYPSYSTLQNYQDYAPEQVENFRMSSAGMWIPKDYTTDEESTLDKATLDWFRNHEAYQNQWQNYSPNGADQWQADMAEFAKMKRPNENWKEAEDRFAEKYGRNPYTWAASTFDKNYFTPKTGLTYFEYDENGNLKPKQEISGLQFRAIPKLGKKQKKEDNVFTQTKEDPKQEDPNIPAPNWQKAQRRRLPDPRYADILGEIGSTLQQIRRYPSMYSPMENAPYETIYRKYNPQPVMGAYTTALQNAGTGPDGARNIDNVTGKVLESIAQGQEQTEEQVNNPRFLDMLARQQQAKLQTSAAVSGEKVRYLDDVASKWQDYLANYNKKLANVTEKAATTAENRYKLGLLQAMYPYANLNFDEFPTANATLNSITDEPVATSSNSSDNFSTLQQNAYKYYLSQGMSKEEAAKAAIEHIKAQIAYNKMYSGTAMSPFVS